MAAAAGAGGARPQGDAARASPPLPRGGTPARTSCFCCRCEYPTASTPVVAKKRLLCEEIVDVPVEQHIEQIVHVPKVPAGQDPSLVVLTPKPLNPKPKGTKQDLKRNFSEYQEGLCWNGRKTPRDPGMLRTRNTLRPRIRCDAIQEPTLMWRRSKPAP